MNRTRQFLLSALVFAIIPPALMGGSSNTVEYVGGTVKSIPANTIGSFDFNNGKQMRFNYGGIAAYELEYDQITGTDISKADGHHILHKIPVPVFNPNKKKETLSVHFKDEAGATGTLNFELAAEEADHVRNMIAIMKAGPQNVLSSQSSNDWWGDKYWKTNRNKGAWEAGNPANSQSAANTPSATK
ncbi:MAG: hypothetical protein ABSB86_09060 [Bryobacteraceae bacterium]|jgi:hypothetical protein